MPDRYRKKPIEIEAVRWDGTAVAATPIIDWILNQDGSAAYHCPHDMGCAGTAAGHTIGIRTLEGRMQATPGDWIIRGIQGEFYPCKPDIFAATYELVEETTHA